MKHRFRLKGSADSRIQKPQIKKPRMKHGELTSVFDPYFIRGLLIGFGVRPNQSADNSRLSLRRRSLAAADGEAVIALLRRQFVLEREVRIRPEVLRTMLHVIP